LQAICILVLSETYALAERLMHAMPREAEVMVVDVDHVRERAPYDEFPFTLDDLEALLPGPIECERMFIATEDRHAPLIASFAPSLRRAHPPRHRSLGRWSWCSRTRGTRPRGWSPHALARRPVLLIGKADMKP
jgi:hypothetical protein